MNTKLKFVMAFVIGLSLFTLLAFSGGLQGQDITKEDIIAGGGCIYPVRTADTLPSKPPVQKNRFKVCDVEPATKSLGLLEYEQILKGIIAKSEQGQKGKAPVVLCSSLDQASNLVPAQGNHPLVLATYQAYADHRPLSFSPDHVWLMIAQGFSLHVNQNAEELRHLFVDHEGQIELKVKRRSYQPQNKAWWEGIFPDFSKAIAENTKGEVMEMITADFSSTGFAEKAAYEITLMDAMSAYFEYTVSISCGIPEITVEGTPEDWAIIEQRLDQLEGYELDWWVDDLRPIIKEFKLAAAGEANKNFWKDIFLAETERVGCANETHYKGWVFKFFPYLKNGKDKKGEVQYRQNPQLLEKTAQAHEGLLDLTNIPTGLSKAKVLLDNNGKKSILYFNAGFTGIEQDANTLCLRPAIQWFVTDTQTPPSKEELAKAR